MITAQPTDGARLVARLADKARRLGEATAEARARERRGDARRWRIARLLWPLMAKER